VLSLLAATLPASSARIRTSARRATPVMLSLFHTTQGFFLAPKISGRAHPAVQRPLFPVATAEMSAPERKADIGLGCVEHRLLTDPKRSAD
jgi:hypothetical protein